MTTKTCRRCKQNLPLDQYARDKSVNCKPCLEERRNARGPRSNPVKRGCGTRTRVYSAEFEEFWNAYGKKSHKGPAYISYKNALLETDHETLVRLATEYAAKFGSDRRYQKIAHSWLLRKPWNGRKLKPGGGTAYYLERCEKYGIEPKVIKFSIQSLVERHGDACYYCGEDWEHVEHVIPVAAGGEHSLDNCVPSCADCNYKKLDYLDKLLIAEFRERGAANCARNIWGPKP